MLGVRWRYRDLGRNVTGSGYAVVIGRSSSRSAGGIGVGDAPRQDDSSTPVRIVGIRGVQSSGLSGGHDAARTYRIAGPGRCTAKALVAASCICHAECQRDAASRRYGAARSGAGNSERGHAFDQSASDQSLPSC